MPFDSEFLHHLHELMVEVSDNLHESEAKYKSEVLFKAQKTNNSAAIPAAYADAALHAIRSRIDQTIEKYIEALSICGISVDSLVERDMQHQINILAVAPSSLHFPPGLREHNFSAVQREYAREKERVLHQLKKQGANRLRELKMRSSQLCQTPPAAMINNYHAPTSNVYNLVHHPTFTINVTQSIVQDMELASHGHPPLEEAAREVAAAPDKASMLQRAKSWVALLASVEGLAEKVGHYYPQLAAFIHSLS